MEQDYEVGFIAENAAANLHDIENFGKTVDAYFPNDVLTGLTVCLWTASDTVGFWLVFETFEQQVYRARFQEWMDQYNVKVLEVMHKKKDERDRLRTQFLEQADMRFHGAFDMGIAFRAIADRLRTYKK